VVALELPSWEGVLIESLTMPMSLPARRRLWTACGLMSSTEATLGAEHPALSTQQSLRLDATQLGSCEWISFDQLIDDFGALEGAQQYLNR